MGHVMKGVSQGCLFFVLLGVWSVFLSCSDVLPHWEQGSIVFFLLQTIAEDYALPGCVYWRCPCIVIAVSSSERQFTLLLFSDHLIETPVCVWGRGGMRQPPQLTATVAPAGTTLNIQQLGSTAPECSTNYRSPPPPSTTPTVSFSLPPLCRASLWTLGVLHRCVGESC